MIKHHRNVAIRFVYTAADRELIDEIDDLVHDAVGGDDFAVTGVGIAFGPVLANEVRRELGPGREQDVRDVVRDFCSAMREGKLTQPPIRGGALPWM